MRPTNPPGLYGVANVLIEKGELESRRLTDIPGDPQEVKGLNRLRGRYIFASDQPGKDLKSRQVARATLSKMIGAILERRGC